MVESPSEFTPQADPLPFRLPDRPIPAPLAPLGVGDLLTRVATIEQHLRYMYQLNGDSSHQPWYRPPGVEPA
jgi:hypothetical protein